MMSKEIEIFRQVRKFMDRTIKTLNIDELNTIPTGFNNNIVWNLGHLLAIQQQIIYGASGLPLKLETTYLDLFKPSTKPETKYNEQEINDIKKLIITQTEELEKDWENGVFKEYRSWTHGDTGIVVDSIESALKFLIFHESMHFEAIKLIKLQMLVK